MTCAVILFLAYCFIRIKLKGAEQKVRIADVPAIFEKLHATGKDGSFVVFLFRPPGEKAVVNFQFSIEDGRMGLDWVLIDPSNIRDRDKFTRFAEKLGYNVLEEVVNKVKCLRVEDGGNLLQLGQALISDLYRLPPEAELYLIQEGFPPDKVQQADY